MVFKLSVDLGSELALAWSTKLQMCTRQREIETEMSGGGGLFNYFPWDVSYKATPAQFASRVLVSCPFSMCHKLKRND